MRCSILSVGFYSVLLILGARVLPGQVDTGAISGVVKDSDDRLFPAANVTILHTETGIVQALRTNGDGFYSAPALRPGLYVVSVSAVGFTVVTKSGIEVRVQDRLRVDFTLFPGHSGQAITVVSQTSPIQTEDASMGQVVDARTMRGLPLNGRNYIELATLTPGVSPSRRGAERNTFVSNGARAVQNVYLLDGVDNKNRIVGFDSSAAQAIEPGIDGVEEFKVQTSGFSAEFGQAAGAVVNVTLRSGTNQFHGSLFEYLRNSFFDATPYFQVKGEAPKFNQNQFGATLGGPFRKERSFFFFSWQSLRAVSAAPQLGAVPTLDQRSGIFQAPIYDPATAVPNPNGKGYVRAPFAWNSIPRNRWDPVAVQLLALFPLPNVNRATNFFSNQREDVSNDQFNIRGDHRFRAADSFFARASFSRGTNLLPAALPPPANSVISAWPEAQTLAAGETHIFGSSLMNEVRVGYLETRVQQQVPGENLNAQYGIKGVPFHPEIHGLPVFAVGGLSALGSTGPGILPLSATGAANTPSDKQGRNLQLLDNLSWTKARHTVKVGGEFSQATVYGDVSLAARPTFDFSGVYTQNPQNRAGTGAAFADFLLGWPNDFALSTLLRTECRQRVYAGYIQDNWKAASKLTLDFGLRYELPMPWYETAGRYADFILDAGSPVYGSLITASQAAQHGYRRSFANPDFRAFAPRFGAAYPVTPQTVIRAGFGVFYGRIDENLGVVYRPTDNPPYLNGTIQVGDQIHPLITLSGGLPPGVLQPENLKGLNLVSWPSRMPVPYTMAWNFNVQRELPGRFVAQVAYVGNSGHDLYVMLNVNKPPPGPGPIGPRRPFPNYNSIGAYLPFVRSNYQSGIVQVERSFHRGFSFVGAYTWSHSIDNGGSVSDIGDMTAQNSYNLQAERGSSNFDVRQRLSIAYIYELPFGRGKSWLSAPGTLRTILGGWQLSGITALQTGLPFSPILSFDPTNSGTAARPDVVPGAALYPSRRDPLQWFNPSAFAAPAAYTYGNAGRNIIRGPASYNQDLALQRFVAIGESHSVEFGAQAFNLFNTPQFGLPNNRLGLATTGTISSVVTPERQLQVGLHFRF